MSEHKVIIVGERNVSRSVMAEAILSGIMEDQGQEDIDVQSRGLVVLFSEPISPIAAQVLVDHAYPIRKVRSEQITKADLDADLILTLTRKEADQLRDMYGSDVRCMFIGVFAEMEEEIPEVTEEKESYGRCFSVLEPLLEEVAARIIHEILEPAL